MLSSYVTTIVAAVISAFACGVVAQYGTPIDTALPLIAVIITIVAAISTPAIQLAVPLLMGGEILIADERLRLLWFGLVIGLVFAAALFRADGFLRAAILTISAIVLLRWIPMSNVVIWREALLMALALLIVAALQPSRLGVPVAVAVALFTPMFPADDLVSGRCCPDRDRLRGSVPGCAAKGCDAGDGSHDAVLCVERRACACTGARGSWFPSSTRGLRFEWRSRPVNRSLWKCRTMPEA